MLYHGAALLHYMSAAERPVSVIGVNIALGGEGRGEGGAKGKPGQQGGTPPIKPTCAQGFATGCI